jgi:hypothetical protein
MSPQDEENDAQVPSSEDLKAPEEAAQDAQDVSAMFGSLRGSDPHQLASNEPEGRKSSLYEPENETTYVD